MGQEDPQEKELATHFPGGSDSKVSTRNAGNPGSIPGLAKSPGERNGNPLQYSWQSTPVFLPEKSHGQRSLAGYSPRGHKESDATEYTQQQNTEKSRELFHLFKI